MTDRRSAKVSKPKRLKSPQTTTAASLMLHEAMAAFRKEMLAEDESDDDDDPDDSNPRPQAYGDNHDSPASSPRSRITAKFKMQSDKPGEMTATVTRESQQSDGSWKATVRHESLPTVINPFTGKPTTLSTPKLRSGLVTRKETPGAPGGGDKKWRVSPTTDSSSSSSPSSSAASRARGLENAEIETPSWKPKTTWPPRNDSLNWRSKLTRVTKVKGEVKEMRQQQQRPFVPSPPTPKAASPPKSSFPSSPRSRTNRTRKLT